MASSYSREQQFLHTSGVNDPVWVHRDKFANRPHFDSLTAEYTECDVCIVGGGIAGISIAHELVTRGKHVVLLEARELLSGESGRTSGHLSNALDDHYTEIAKKHGLDGAKKAADSHTWAIEHVGDVAKALGIECEYRRLPAYEISEHVRGSDGYEEDMQDLQAEAKLAKELGIDAEFRADLTVKGWDGARDQRGGAIFHAQAAFHPTLYLVGVLKWLKEQPNFRCFTNTRVAQVEETRHGLPVVGEKYVKVHTEQGCVVECAHAVEATNIPLQKLSVVAELEYKRSYCIAIRVPKGSVEDCFLYDSAEEYKYVRLTQCDDQDDNMIVGGCDHKVGQELTAGRFDELETWTRERFTAAGAVDYRWSGQILEPVDYMAFIGKNQGQDRVYIATGDSGNGLTHFVLAGRLIADEIEGVENPWASLYAPSRTASIAKVATTMLAHDLQINAQYKRLLHSDIQDIEDLAPGEGGVLNPMTKKPIAVYKDENGKVSKVSAFCPHLKGVVCWNSAEKSWDCPVHGSRFSAQGVCVQGPAKGNLTPVE